MNIFKVALIPLIIAAFLIGSCAQDPLTTTTLKDSDGDGIPDLYEIQGNDDDTSYNYCTVRCLNDPDDLSDDVCLDCTSTSDCNCNDIADGEEEEFTLEQCKDAFPEQCGDKKNHWYAYLGGGLVGGFFAGMFHEEIWSGITWPYRAIFGDDEDKVYEVTDVCYYPFQSDCNGKQSYIEFDDNINQLKISIYGICTNKNGDKKSCDFELIATIAQGFPTAWESTSPIYKKSTLAYYYDPKLNSIKITAPNPFNDGTSETYTIHDPHWFGLNYSFEDFNQNTIYVGGFSSDVATKLQINESQSKSCLYPDGDPIRNAANDYIEGKWLRNADSYCSDMP